MGVDFQVPRLFRLYCPERDYLVLVYLNCVVVLKAFIMDVIGTHAKAETKHKFTIITFYR